MGPYSCDKSSFGRDVPVDESLSMAKETFKNEFVRDISEYPAKNLGLLLGSM